MLGRLLAVTLIAASCTLTAAGPAAACTPPGVQTGTDNQAAGTFGDVSFEMREFTPNAVCSSGPGTSDPVRSLVIEVGGVAVCDLSEGIDPSFDPFLFGAGIHMDHGTECGAEFSAASITDPLVPATPVVEGTSATAGVSRTVFVGADPIPSLWYTADGRKVTVTGLADLPMTVFRGTTAASV